VLKTIRSINWRRRLPAALGIAMAAALTAAAADGGTKLVVVVENVFASANEPLAVTVETNSSVISGLDGVSMLGVIPRRIHMHSSPSSCTDLVPWLRREGGVEGGSTRLRVVAQGQSATPVLISNLRVNVLHTGPPVAGTSLYCGTQGVAQIRPIFIDLDAQPPTVRFGSGTHPFGFTVGPGEIETFDIEASTERAYVRWTLTLQLLVGGHREAVQIDDHGRPFETTPAPAAHDAWSWDYSEGWESPSGQTIPAGHPLAPTAP
jgi:hypothetical protein